MVAYDFDATTVERSSLRLERSDRTKLIFSDVGELLVRTDEDFVRKISQLHLCKSRTTSASRVDSNSKSVTMSADKEGVDCESTGENKLFDHDSLQAAETAEETMRGRFTE